LEHATQIHHGHRERIGKRAPIPDLKALRARIGHQPLEIFFGWRTRSQQRCERKVMIEPDHRLSVVQQAQVLELSRSSVIPVIPVIPVFHAAPPFVQNSLAAKADRLKPVV
jgi:hypothetical protein